MTRKELNNWLYELKPLVTEEGTDKTVSWITKVLKTLSFTIDKRALVDDISDVNLADVLYIVAYSTPDIPFSLRKEKPFFHSCDYEEFYLNNDKDYKIFWERYIKKTINTKYLVAIS